MKDAQGDEGDFPRVCDSHIQTVNIQAIIE